MIKSYDIIPNKMSVFTKKLIRVSLVLLAFFYIVNIAFAQEYISNSVSSIDLSFSPFSPSAGDSVILTVSSDSLDLNSSKIVWYIDNVARKEAASQSITIKTKSSGEKTSVKVVVETSDGIIKEVSREISPGGVDLIVEPIAYTMPFYKGKPYFIKEGMAKIIAVPDVVVNGVKVSNKNLSFKWSRDNTVLGSNSGRGQNTIVINSSIPIRDIIIGVEISDVDGNVLGEKSKKIILDDPKILFYENSPLYGVLYNKAIINSYYLGTREELRIAAKPFSFSFLTDTSSDVSFSWSINDSEVLPTGKINEMLLKQTTVGAKGVASIFLNLSNNNKMNQYTSKGFDVEFGQ
jgi:hypothetical protein